MFLWQAQSGDEIPVGRKRVVRYIWWRGYTIRVHTHQICTVLLEPGGAQLVVKMFSGLRRARRSIHRPNEQHLALPLEHVLHEPLVLDLGAGRQEQILDFMLDFGALGRAGIEELEGEGVVVPGVGLVQHHGPVSEQGLLLAVAEVGHSGEVVGGTVQGYVLIRLLCRHLDKKGGY